MIHVRRLSLSLSLSPSLSLFFHLLVSIQLKLRFTLLANPRDTYTHIHSFSLKTLTQLVSIVLAVGSLKTSTFNLSSPKMIVHFFFLHVCLPATTVATELALFSLSVSLVPPKITMYTTIVAIQPPQFDSVDICLSRLSISSADSTPHSRILYKSIRSKI